MLQFANVYFVDFRKKLINAFQIFRLQMSDDQFDIIYIHKSFYFRILLCSNNINQKFFYTNSTYQFVAQIQRFLRTNKRNSTDLKNTTEETISRALAIPESISTSVFPKRLYLSISSRGTGPKRKLISHGLAWLIVQGCIPNIQYTQDVVTKTKHFHFATKHKIETFVRSSYASIYDVRLLKFAINLWRLLYSVREWREFDGGGCQAKVSHFLSAYGILQIIRNLFINDIKKSSSFSSSRAHRFPLLISSSRS